MSGRVPNSGPYVVTYGYGRGISSSHECHTWIDACMFMRYLLLEGYTEINVRFA